MVHFRTISGKGTATLHSSRFVCLTQMTTSVSEAATLALNTVPTRVGG